MRSGGVGMPGGVLTGGPRSRPGVAHASGVVMAKRPRVGEILVEAGVIDDLQLRAALGDQANWGARLGLTLVKMGLIEERDLVWALAQQLQIPVVQLEGKRIRREILDLVPVELAEKYMCIPLFIRENEGFRTLFVGMDDPANLEALDDLGFRTELRIRPVLVSASELCAAIDRFYHRPESGWTRESSEAQAWPLDEGGEPNPASRDQAGIQSIPEIQESLFPEVAGIDAEASGAIRRMADESDSESRATAPPVKTASDSTVAPVAGGEKNRTILHALCRLLVEKQVIDRDELRKVVRELEAK
jgi:hypothetical protein